MAITKNSSNQWQVSPSLDSDKTLYTAGTIVDSDILVKSAKSVTGNASFANTATSGTTYTDYSSSAPILITGDYLYINAGYTPARKISLAKLVPDDLKGTAINFAAASQVLTGKYAWDENGAAIAGTMPNNPRIGLSSEVGTTTNADLGSDTYVYYRLDEGYYPATAWRGTPLSTFGTATKAQVLKGKTFTSTAGLKVSGTIETVTATASTTASSASTSVTGMETTTTNTGFSVHAEATSGTASASAPVGYVATAVSSSQSAKTASETKYIIAGAITNNTSGGTSTATINSGKQIKISKGYYSNDVYYTAQSQNASSTTPSTTYYTTTNTGYGKWTKNTYSTSDQYIKAAATPALAITDSSTAITPAAISGDTTKFNITTSVTGKTTYTTAGWIPTTGLAAATDSSATVGTIVAGAVSDLSSDVTVPSGTTPTTISRGRKFKISKGWYPNDLYYQAQGDAHSSYTPSSTYFTTTNTGYGPIEASKYATSAYYIKNGAYSSSITTTTTTTYPQLVSTAGWRATSRIQGVTLTNSQNFDITVPNGTSGNITFHFHVDASGNVTVD